MSSAHYRVDHRIGSGGMAEVLEAVVVGEGGFERRVALKQLLPEAAQNESFVNGFIDESRIVSQLHHANIVSVFDFGTMDDRPFIVMELVDGADVESLAQDVLPTAIALHLTTEVAHALSYAHTARDAEGEPMRIVHRDVNPRNILLSWDGDVKLTDFGIARAAHRLQATQIGIAKGTLAYMAPEQVSGRTIDHRADIFGLGCTLHRLLTRQSPLVDDEQRRTFLAGGRLSLSGLPEDVLPIIERAIRFAPEDRYGSAAEMASDCGAVLARLVSRDIRTIVREWIAPHQPQQKQPKQKQMADLFDLALVEESIAEPIRRFKTTARQDGQMSRSEVSFVSDPVTPFPEQETQSGGYAPTYVPARTPSVEGLLNTNVRGYLLTRFLGQGGWACVYEAQHEILDRRCAVKVLRPDRPHNEVASKRLLREAVFASKLNHPNLVPVIDCGVLPDGRPFLIMELLEGRTLSQAIKLEGAIEPIRAARIARQIASGLAEAHRNGLVHRDLKPANVMLVTEDGMEVAKLLDFGIARALDRGDDQTRLTEKGMMLGTPAYMAPEQIRSSSNVGSQVDLYAFGVMLYQVVGGSLPFRGSVSQIVHSHLHENPPEIPYALGLGRLAIRLMEKDPAARPQLEEVEEELHNLDTPEAIELTAPIFPAPVATVAPSTILPRSIALMLVVVILTVATLVYVSQQPNTSELVVISDPVPGATPEISPGVVVVQKPPKEQRSTKKTPEKVKRTKRRTTDSRKGTRELEQHLHRSLAKHGIKMKELDREPLLTAELKQWRSALSNNDQDSAKEALSPLLAGIERMAVDPDRITNRLDHVAVLLKRVAAAAEPDQVEQLEARYFQLRARHRPSASTTERASLAQEIAAFIRELSREL